MKYGTLLLFSGLFAAAMTMPAMADDAYHPDKAATPAATQARAPAK